MTQDNNGVKIESHTISVFVANKPGVLARVTQVFTRRGFNIDSLAVSPGREGNYSRMTITASGDLETVDQIIKQLTKLIDVISATDHQHQNCIEKELSLIKVDTTDKNRQEILQLTEHFGAKAIDFTAQSVILSVVGSTEKIDAFTLMLRRFGIIEIVRTGKILMARGKELT